MKGKHVLVTGHTGFKGAWLTAMLKARGAIVSGIALDPLANSVFEKAEISDLLENDVRLDIRDSAKLAQTIKELAPTYVFHLAAQPLVIASYDNPKETYEVNVDGTLNVLSAIVQLQNMEACVIVTTDKVYRQNGSQSVFSEEDPLGAADPYSTSKAMADLLTQSWIKSNSKQPIAIARAGNVIGGGDVAPNRLLPDLIQAFERGQVAAVRNPSSTRPWQHVLDCLDGYLLLAEHLAAGKVAPGPFNFGPNTESPLTVKEVADLAANSWGQGASWFEQKMDLPSEAPFLALDSTKSRTSLGWQDKLSSKQAIEWTVAWHKQQLDGFSALQLVERQIQNYSTI